MHTIHAVKPNEIIHFDFLYMGPGIHNFKYILVIKDDLSSYVWLCPATSANAETVAKELSRWIDTFTFMSLWSSDQGTHFKNQVIGKLAEIYRIKHYFITTYSPWANGSVERCMREILRACEVLLAEFRLGPQDWPTVVSLIQSVLNSAPLKRLGQREDGTQRTPLEVMTGIHPRRTIFKTTRYTSNETVRIIDEARAIQILAIEDIQQTFEDMHHQVEETKSAARQAEIHKHNERTNIVQPNFHVGDYVLVRRMSKQNHKLAFRWTGPRVILRSINQVVYEVKSLKNGTTEQVHAVILLPYRDDLRGTPASDKIIEHATHTEASYDMIEEILDIGEEDRVLWLRLKWLGLPDKKDYTWQTLAILMEDVPDMVIQYLDKCKKKRLVKKARGYIATLTS